MVLHIGTFLLLNLLCGLHYDILYILQLFLLAYQRNHDLGNDVVSALLFHLDSSLHNSSGLHLGDLRIGNSQTAATVTHHGVELVKLIAFCLNLLRSHTHILSQSLDILGIGGNELMQRRIQVTNGHGSALQSLVHRLEVALLERNQLV